MWFFSSSMVSGANAFTGLNSIFAGGYACSLSLITAVGSGNIFNSP